eukprot:351583-Chlamydomonas_euryale.AAC.11
MGLTPGTRHQLLEVQGVEKARSLGHGTYDLDPDNASILVCGGGGVALQVWALRWRCALWACIRGRGLTVRGEGQTACGHGGRCCAAPCSLSLGGG